MASDRRPKIWDRKYISVACGLEYDNPKSHRKGIDMDRDATIKLIRLFAQHPKVTKIFFNDDKVQHAIGRVRSWRGHDDHIHLEIMERS